MAGVKGRSGGARAGAGRKPKNGVKTELEGQPHGGALKRTRQEPVLQEPQDMLEFLQKVALGQTEASTLQVRAAIAAVQYTHAKMGEGGKKEQRDEAAKGVTKGSRFAPSVPPKLVASGGKKV